MQKLHPVQQKLLDVLKDTIDEPLTIRELQELLNMSSPSVVHHHIMQLEKKGYLRRNLSNPKDYQILSDSPEKKIAYLNLYGLAKCGPGGTLLDGNPIDRIPVATKMLGFTASEAFLVKAKGDSMEPKVHEGDFVIAQRHPQPNNGDIVVCSHNATAKIKKIKYSEDRSSAFLISLNPKYDPEIVMEDSLIIEGIVRGVFSYTL